MDKVKELPAYMKTIKLDVRTWDSLKSLKRENETFNDVIKELLNQRTKSVGDGNIHAIRYQRKVSFLTIPYGESIGVEYEYNDVRSNKSDFVLDLKIKKIFFEKKVYSPSQFFGVDNEHKHYSEFFMEVYFQAIENAIIKEFRMPVLHMPKPENLTYWKKLYYEYSFSEESFKNDIEEPLRMSLEDIPTKNWEERINNSTATKFIKEKSVVFA